MSEQKEYDASNKTKEETDQGGEQGVPGIKQFWKGYNLKSLDGLPGLEVAYSSSVPFNDWKNSGKVWGPDDETIRSQSGSRSNEDKPRATLSLVAGEGLGRDLSKVLVGFAAGFVVSSIVSRFVKA